MPPIITRLNDKISDLLLDKKDHHLRENVENVQSSTRTLVVPVFKVESLDNEDDPDKLSRQRKGSKQSEQGTGTLSSSFLSEPRSATLKKYDMYLKKQEERKSTFAPS